MKGHREKTIPHTFSPEQRVILKAHREWVKSKGNRGERFTTGKLEAFEDEDGVAMLRGAYLAQANLQSADREGRPVDFSNCDLTDADISASSFSESNFDGAILAEVEFVDTTMEGASFVGADFSGADLRGADCFAWGDLSEAFYDDETRFDGEFDPVDAGMKLKFEQSSPP